MGLFRNDGGGVLTEGLNHIGLASVLIARSGRILSANKVFLEQRGVKVEDVSFMTIRDVNPNLSLNNWRDIVSRIDKERNFELLTTHLTKDGKIIPVKVNAVGLGTGDDLKIFVVLTEAVGSEKFEYLFNALTSDRVVIPWVYKLDSGEFSFEENDIKLLSSIAGLDSLEKGNDILELLIGEDSLRDIRLNLESLGERNNSFNTEYRVFRKDTGEALWLRFSGVLNNTTETIYGTIQETTEYRLQFIEGFKSKLALEQLEDMVAWLTPAGKHTFVNKAVVKELGFSEEECLSASIWDVATDVSETDWPGVYKQLALGKLKSFESRFRRKSGETFPVHVSASFIDFQGVPYICCIIRNITEERKQRAKIAVAYDKIKQLQDDLEKENVYLRSEVDREYNFRNIISKSDRYAGILQNVKNVAGTDATVLITGESGTGKELLARAVHELSERSGKSLIKVNCAALPENLIESELFGHEKGAFTGAFQKKVGRFELADGGTIFLDEIGELPLELQPKLLRVLQEGEFDPLGSTQTKKVDVRVIAATNRDLLRKVKRGDFREDLFFRLNIFPIHNMPLRERKEDIPLLADHFLGKFTEKMGKTIKGISKPSMERLVKYNFPGNIRELENIIERGVIICNDNILKLPKNLFLDDYASKSADNVEFQGFEEMARQYIIKVLKHTGGKVSGTGGAAEILQMNAKTLDSKMRKYGISKAEIYS